MRCGSCPLSRIREVVGDLTVFARGEERDAREGLADVRRAGSHLFLRYVFQVTP